MKQTVIITGVGKGFGRSLMISLSENYHVVGISRSESDFEDLNKELAQNNAQFDLLAADITNQDLVSKLLDPILSKKHGQVLGIINNAGLRCRENFLELSPDTLSNVLNVNLMAPFFFAQKLMPIFLENKKGRIINISSILSESALPNLSAYTISKSALDGLTRALTAEFASNNITINSVLPGFCKTSYFESFKTKEDLYKMTINRTPAGRWGEDDELHGICKLLLSDEGAYINGASIPVDGGWIAC